MEGEVNEEGQPEGPSEQAIAKRPNEAAIEELKAKHGPLSEIEVDGYIAIVRRPKTFDLERAYKVSEKPGAKKLDFNRNIVSNIVVYIDDDFRKEDGRDQALLSSVNDVVELKQATIKKL